MRRSFTIVVSSLCSSRNSLKMDGAGKLSQWVHFFFPSVQTISKSRKYSMDAKNVFCNLELELRWGLPEEDRCQDSGYWVTVYVEPWKFQNFTKFSTETGRPNGENKTSNFFKIWLKDWPILKYSKQDLNILGLATLQRFVSDLYHVILSPLFLFTVWDWEPQRWGRWWWWWRWWALFILWKPQPSASVRVSYSVLLQLQYSGAVLQSLQPGSVPC